MITVRAQTVALNTDMHAQCIGNNRTKLIVRAHTISLNIGMCMRNALTLTHKDNSAHAYNDTEYRYAHAQCIYNNRTKLIVRAYNIIEYCYVHAQCIDTNRTKIIVCTHTMH